MTRDKCGARERTAAGKLNGNVVGVITETAIFKAFVRMHGAAASASMSADPA